MDQTATATPLRDVVGANISVTRKWTYRYVKRFIDVGLSILGLIFLSPLMIVIGLSIKLKTGGPVFYRWDVIGQGGKPFTGYKFRTMTRDADAVKESLWIYNERKGPTFKMKNDPRITPIGRILRKYSLDELPQLWSVLKGDMSLVGPRPVGPKEWIHFDQRQRRKLSIKPGAVCLWHIQGKPERFSDWIKLDLKYIDHWSLGLDLKILIGTLWYIISGKNY